MLCCLTLAVEHQGQPMKHTTSLSLITISKFIVGDLCDLFGKLIFSRSTMNEWKELAQLKANWFEICCSIQVFLIWFGSFGMMYWWQNTLTWHLHHCAMRNFSLWSNALPLKFYWNNGWKNLSNQKRSVSSHQLNLICCASHNCLNLDFKRHELMWALYYFFEIQLEAQ